MNFTLFEILCFLNLAFTFFVVVLCWYCPSCSVTHLSDTSMISSFLPPLELTESVINSTDDGNQSDMNLLLHSIGYEKAKTKLLNQSKKINDQTMSLVKEKEMYYQDLLRAGLLLGSLSRGVVDSGMAYLQNRMLGVYIYIIVIK